MSEGWKIPENPKLDDFIGSFEGKDGETVRFLYDEMALAFLLLQADCWIDRRKVVDEDSSVEGATQRVIGVAVNANDIFMWASADAESITCTPESDFDQVDEGNGLYTYLREYLANPRWATIKWVALRRNMAPQSPIVKDMIAAGAWDERMQKLPHNSIDGQCCEWHRKLAKENRKATEVTSE